MGSELFVGEAETCPEVVFYTLLPGKSGMFRTVRTLGNSPREGAVLTLNLSVSLSFGLFGPFGTVLNRDTGPPDEHLLVKTAQNGD